MSGVLSAELARDLLGSARTLAVSLEEACQSRPPLRPGAAALSTAQGRMLELLAACGPLGVNALAGLMDVTAAAASQTAARLVERRLLRREADRRDRRAHRLCLTPSAQAWLSTQDASRAETLRETLEQFSPGDLRRAAELMDRLAIALITRTARPGTVCARCAPHHRERCAVRGLGKLACIYER